MIQTARPSFPAVALCALLGLAMAGAAQEPVAVFRSDAHLVVLHATVLDPQGRRVTDLPASAFRVLENGVEQQLKVFHREDSPVSIGLIVDDSGSMIDKRQKVAAAGLSLVRASHPDDEVFILHFNEKAYLDCDFTSDRAKLEQGLAAFDSRGTTALRDALRLAIEHLSRHGKEDKKVLVVITDGEDNCSVIDHDYVVKAAQQSNVMIYAVGLLTEIDDARTKLARRELDGLTQATGGKAFYLDDVSETDSTAREIALEIRDQFTLAYSPSNERLDGTYRKIQVVASGPAALTVRTRAGYYSNRASAGP
jgi:VWFA-related protein